jgi:hypothetical protein
MRCRFSGASTMTCRSINVGHAEKWDQIVIDGSIAARDCLLKCKSRGRVLAVASIYRDLAACRPTLTWSET